MFWENLCRLCNENKTTPNTVCKALGLSSATSTHWRQGSVPRDTTLRLVADYFGITVEELLRSPEEKGSAPAESSPSLPPLAPEFYELLNQMTLQELAELKAHMEEKIKNRR
jgi:transcriptional regulator with XRE-family HTH domain